MVLPGYGFSDLAVVVGIAERIYTTFKDSPGQFQDLSREVKTFKLKIEKFARRFPSNEQNSNGKTLPWGLISESKEVLEKLEKQLEKFKSLATDKKLLSDRLLFESGDNKKLRERLRNLDFSIQGFQVDTILQRTDTMGTQVAQILNEVVRDKFDNKTIGSTLWNVFDDICAGLEKREISMQDIKKNKDLIIDAIADGLEKQKNTLPNNASTTRLNAPARQDYQESDQLSKATVQEHDLDFEDTSASSRRFWNTANLSDIQSSPIKAADEEAEPKASIPRGATKRVSLCTVGSSSIAHDGQPPDPPPASIRDKTILFDQGIFRPPRYSSAEESGLRRTRTSSVGEADPKTITKTIIQSSKASKGTSSLAGSERSSKSSVAGFLSKIGESSWSMSEKIKETIEEAPTSAPP